MLYGEKMILKIPGESEYNLKDKHNYREKCSLKVLEGKDNMSMKENEKGQ